VESVVGNPYLRVTLRARLKRRPTMLLSVVWVAVVVLCIELNYFLYSSPNYHLYPSLPHCFFSIFFQLLGIQLFLALFPTAYYCSHSVTLERSTRSLPLLRATPLSGYAIALGKIATDPSRIWLLLALAVPFTVVCAVIGKVNALTVIEGYALLLAAGFFASSLGLLFSALGKMVTKPVQAGGAAIGLIMTMLFLSQSLYFYPPLNSLAGLSPIPFLISSIARRFPLILAPAAIAEVNPNVNFLGAEVRPFAISFPMYALLGLGCFIGASRRIADDRVPVLSRAQTVCAAVVYELAVCGMVVNFFHPVRSFTGRRLAAPVTGGTPMLTYSLLALAGIVVAALIVTPNRARVENALRKGVGDTGWLHRHCLGDAAPPFPLLAVLFALALVGYGFLARMVLTSAYSPLSRASLAVGACMLFLCATTFSTIVQSCFLTRTRQPVLVAAAALAIYFLLPTVVSSVFQLAAGVVRWIEYVYAINPIHALTRSFAARLSNDPAFFALGASVYVVLTVVLSVGIVYQTRAVARHVERMRSL